MTSRPAAARVPDGATLLRVDGTWFPGRPPGGPTTFLASASGLHPVPPGMVDDATAGDTLPDDRMPDDRMPDDRMLGDTVPGESMPEAGAPVHLPGTILPPFTDAHVHLGLVDPTDLCARGLAAVHYLGWDPDVAATWTDVSSAGTDSARPAPRHGLPRVEFAGAFLTAPGGYPSDRPWAPPGAVREVASPDEAVAAVDRQLAAGASFVKVALNSTAGPVPDDVTLHALVAHAHARGRVVVAHTEGPGQAARAFEAGVDRLAHAPFTERLPDALLRAMAAPAARRPAPAGQVQVRRGGTSAGRLDHAAPAEPAQSTGRALAGERAPSGMTWVSTLDIHGWGRPAPEQGVAIDNVRRFVALGGTVVYGTDLGNGPLPLGVNPRELRALAAAGLSADALLRALTSTNVPGVVTYIPGPRPGALDRPTGADDLTELTSWLARARAVDLTRDLPDVVHPGPASPSGTTTRP